MEFKTQAEEVAHWVKMSRGGTLPAWARRAKMVAALTPQQWAAHNAAENARMAAAAPFVPAAVAAMAAQLRRKGVRG